MLKSFRYAAATIAIALAMWGGGSILLAQESRNEGATTTRTVVDNDGFNPGWIGLAGLIGLLGLMPRDRRDRHTTTAVHTANRP